MKLTSILSTTAIVTGAAVGSFSFSAALDGDPSDQGQRRVEVSTDPVLFEPTDGHEPAKFDYEVSGALKSGTDVAHLIEVSKEQACIHVDLGEGYAEDCFFSETIAAGNAWAAFSQADGSFVMVGVVPDSVDKVAIGGKEADLKGNVWSTTVASADPTDLRVESSVDGKISVLDPAK